MVGGHRQAGALGLQGSRRCAPTTTVTCFPLFCRKYCRNWAVQLRDRSLNAYVAPCHSSSTFSPSRSLERWTTSLWRNLRKARWIRSAGTAGRGHCYVSLQFSLSFFTLLNLKFLSLLQDKKSRNFYPKRYHT